jgi:GNAT superfamily N-acetyltransferase
MAAELPAIQPAQEAHVPAMVALSEQKRAEYAAYQPLFWRKAVNSADVQTPYFRRLLTQENMLALVALEGETVVGFVIAAVVPAPPVYDPGGLTCLIDDFCVAQPEQWPTVGRALLAAVTAQAAERGACQAVVVCGHRDEPKRALLRSAGLSISSEWYVSPIGLQT